MALNLIWAQARNGVIGRDNTIPWRLPEDLAHFKALTLGHPVIMGRRTWDSLPPRFRPLPGRRNIVVTRNPGWAAEGAERADSLDAALALCADAGTCWVIGGAQLYALALPRAHRLEITEIDAEYLGDAFAPALGPKWREVARERHVAASGVPFAFVTRVKDGPPPGA